MCENCGKCGCGEKKENDYKRKKNEGEKISSDRKKDHAENFSFVEI